MGAFEVELRTLTPLWTGGVDQQSDRVHETGLIGSLRWWYEALVRGVGGCACDPTSEDRCPDDDGRHCAACELFGCTGWARKFRLCVLDSKGQLIQGPLKPGVDFKLRFIEMRPILAVERWLLTKAMEVAAEYGALGGKTTLKPQARTRVGDDYGVLEWRGGFSVSTDGPEIKRYLLRGRRRVATRLPDLRWFFFLKGSFLSRTQINALVGLSENGRRVIERREFQEFLRGQRPSHGTGEAVSKKVFSFKANGGRIWGYARDEKMRDKIIEQIEKKLGDGKCTLKTGEEVLREL